MIAGNLATPNIAMGRSSAWYDVDGLAASVLALIQITGPGRSLQGRHKARGVAENLWASGQLCGGRLPASLGAIGE